MRTAAGGLGLLLTPAWARGLASTATPRRERPHNTVVLIQLVGGNDGLNTVIPLQDKSYRMLRPTLAIAPEQTLPLDRLHGLHPSCIGLHDLFQNDRLALLPMVGTGQPVSGHFAAEEHVARGQCKPCDDSGWVGRWLDYRAADQASTAEPAAIYIGTHLPAELRSRQSHPIMAMAPADILFRDDGSARGSDSGLFGRSLRMLVDLMERDAPSICCLTLGGFDTHRNQSATHARLLRILSDGLGEFQCALESRQLADQVLTMVWSEFGRHPRENGEGGTDHGTAGTVLLVGTRVNGGIVGPPMRAEPTADDVADFRQVYATLLEDWMGCPAANVLDHPWSKLSLLRPAAGYLPMP